MDGIAYVGRVKRVYGKEEQGRIGYMTLRLGWWGRGEGGWGVKVSSVQYSTIFCLCVCKSLCVCLSSVFCLTKFSLCTDVFI